MRNLKITIAILTCAVCGFNSHILGQETPSIRLGYTDALEAANGYTVASTDVEVSAAIYLTPELLSKYAGCELSGAQSMLHSRLNIDRLDMWIRTGLEADDIQSTTITRDSNPAIAKGQNKVSFKTPYIIPDNPREGIYIGVTYHQTGSAIGVSYSAQSTPYAAYVKNPGKEWEDISTDHTFFIEAILTGDALPLVNLRLEQADFSPYYVIDKGIYTGKGVVRNIGINPVNNFDINLKMQDIEEPFTYHFDCDIPYGETFEFAYSFPMRIEQAAGEREALLTITDVNGDTDTDMTDNSVAGKYRIVPYDMTHRVLVEEFTTERCSNCPRVAGWLHDLLETPHYNELIVPVCHHSGYGSDFLTIPSDKEYEWFYSPANIFAPAVMIDRMRSNNGAAPFNPADMQAIAQNVDISAALPAEVSVSLHAEYDENNVYMTVRGSKTVEQLCENPHLVCVVTEDDIPAQMQLGYGGSEPYMHQHVSRAVNETFGVPVPFEGDEYEYTVTLPLSNVSNKENMNVVAYIFNYDDSDRNNCQVKNAALLPFKEMTVSSTAEIENDMHVPTEWYTISGIRLNAKPTDNGIYIERRGNKSSKILVN